MSLVSASLSLGAATGSEKFESRQGRQGVDESTSLVLEVEVMLASLDPTASQRSITCIEARFIGQPLDVGRALGQQSLGVWAPAVLDPGLH